MENQINAEQTNVVEAGGTQVGTQAVPGQAENSASVEQGNQNGAASSALEGGQEGASVGDNAQGSSTQKVRVGVHDAQGSSSQGTRDGQEKTGQGQNGATNRRFADIRRNYEGKLKAAQAEKDAAVKAKEIEMVKSLYPSNPYTGKAIEDEYDVEEFLTMKSLSEQGHDPVTAYSEKIKEGKRQADRDAKLKADGDSQKQSRASTYLKEFREKYKDVSVSELLNDKDFMEFGGRALEVAPLTKVYEAYTDFKQKTAAQQKAAAMAANAQVAVGSATNPEPGADSEFYTKEQVLKMSPAEISKNYEKIRASQMKW